MNDVTQPARPAGENDDVRGDPVAAAAEAFKRTVGEEEGLDPGLRSPPSRGQADDDEAQGEVLRDAHGAGDEAGLDPGLDLRSSSTRRGDEEEEDDAAGRQDGAEGQSEAVAMPASWGKEDEAVWASLPAEAQARIAEREGKRERTVTRKFQEAAELLRANQALLAEAQRCRQHYVEAAELALGLVVPQPPPRSMLDKDSKDYDPDQYHLRKAAHDEAISLLAQHRQQLGQARAAAQLQQFQVINNATRDAFIASVPEVADQAKAPAVFRELIDYAATLGAPPEAFAAPTTALEWHCLWKAREYDRLQAAKAKVSAQPKPEPRKPAPAVRPGVTTPRAAIERQQRGAALERLRSEGSLDAGAAALKHLLKGKLS